MFALYVPAVLGSTVLGEDLRGKGNQPLVIKFLVMVSQHS